MLLTQFAIYNLILTKVAFERKDALSEAKVGSINPESLEVSGRLHTAVHPARTTIVLAAVPFFSYFSPLTLCLSTLPNLPLVPPPASF